MGYIVIKAIAMINHCDYEIYPIPLQTCICDEKHPKIGKEKREQHIQVKIWKSKYNMIKFKLSYEFEFIYVRLGWCVLEGECGRKTKKNTKKFEKILVVKRLRSEY